MHAAIRHLDKGLYPKSFCRILPDYTGEDPDWCTIIHADGAGTKSSLAYIYWKETGDLSVWEGIAQDAIVMNLDDMMCSGATGPFLLSSTIGRNRKLIPAEVISAIISGSDAFTGLMNNWGINIFSGGGETADVGDLVRTIVVDSTMAARMPRANVIDNAKIEPGDVIIGLSSYGRAIYETAYNGGMGSNGLTSARHDVFSPVYAARYPESFDPSLDKSLVYSGKLNIDSVTEIPGINAGKLVLSPTRTYAPVLRRILDNYREVIHGMIHCTGGGQTKVLHFIDNLHVVKDDLFPFPPLFRMIQEQSSASLEEMFKVFNMGHRLEIYLNETFAGDVMDIAEHYGIEAQVIGHCEAFTGRKLTISCPAGTFTYT